MNNLHKDKLATLADDEHMLKAIKTLFYDRIEGSKPDIDKTNDNKILGEKYRASKEAEKLIEGVLQDISSYKTQRSGDNKLDKGK